ncbi:MAG: hypothetical protein DRQ47_09090, partial [Gammaproteobacteria bacterium]
NTARELESQFNGQTKDKIILAIEETYAKSYEDQEKIYNIMKTMISEDVLSVRSLYKQHEICKSYLNLILTSNKPHALHLEERDRRITVAYFQTNPYTPPSTNVLSTLIEQELPYLYHYLLTTSWDVYKASKPFDTPDKANLIKRSSTPINLIILALYNKDYEFIADSITEEEGIGLYGADKIYRDAAISFINDKPTTLSKNELYIFIQYFYPKITSVKTFKDYFISLGIMWFTQIKHDHLGGKRLAGIKLKE